MDKRRLWTREEFILALNLYYKLPFGRLNQSTKEVKELAKLIGRTSSSVAMRLTNFAACAPYIINTGRHGLAAGAKQCQPYWDEFNSNREKLLFESEEILASYQNLSIDEKFKDSLTNMERLEGEDKIREVKTRVNQSVFRSIIISNYDGKCALTGIDMPELLPRILDQEGKVYYEKYFGSINHVQLTMPEEHCPDKVFLEWHMDTRFQR